MYTETQIVKKDFDVNTQQIVLLVRFTGVDKAHDKKFYFAPDVTKEQWERHIKRELVRLNSVVTKLATINEGALDLSAVSTDEVLTQAQTDERTWFRDIEILKRVHELNTIGGMPATWQADLDALKTKVQTNAKKSYIPKM